MRILLYALTVLWITIKRIVRNWRLIGALLAGLMLASAIMAAVPIYTSGSLQKSFLRTWAEQDQSRPPFGVITTHRNDRRRFNIATSRLDRLQDLVENELPRAVRIEPDVFATYGRIGSDPFIKDRNDRPDLLSPTADLCFLSNLGSLSDMVVGRWFEPREDGVVEVVVDEATLRRLELVVGERYTFHYTSYDSEAANKGERYLPVELELVGMFRPADGTTTRDWIYPPPFLRRLFVNPEVFRNTLQGEMQLRVDDYDFLTVFPYDDVRVNRIDTISKALKAFELRATRIAPETALWRSPIRFFDLFTVKMRSISLFLLALAIPTLGMVLYYVVLMAGVAVDNRRSEMTVLQSRGAGRAQVMSSFFIEWVLLGLVGLVAGPFLGYGIALIMGSTADFLGFVNRSALPVAINWESFGYALIASAVAVIAATIPVFSTFRHSIVTLRAQQARGLRRSVWHRYYLDIILIALAVFGHRALSWEQVRLSPDASIEADPILFFVPVVGLLGVGLFILRIYPFVMSLLARLTSRLRGVVWQLVFRRLQRNASQYIPILLLLIVTVSLGVYTATAARTLSQNFVDQINYHIGADVVIDEQWEDTGPPNPGGPPPPPPLGEVTAEPPLLVREEIEGVEAVARVLRGTAQLSTSDGTAGSAHFMAIAPHEFARVAWFRDDLFEAHFYQYLNLLNRHSEGAIISRWLQERGDLELGSLMTVDWDGERFDTYVVAVVDFWPGIDPYARNSRRFLITNLSYVQDQTRLRPYFGWYKVTDDADVQAIVRKLTVQGIFPQDVVDARAEITKLRREPYRMGFYGVLTMGFLVSAAVTALGFLIYTFYSVKSRLLQFGALRANGLSLWQLVSAVGLEQLVSLGTGLGIGYGLGRTATAIFVPFLRERAGGIRQAPPFRLILQLSDVNLIFIVIGSLFVGAVLGLSLFLVRKRLFSSLKLGEEV